MADTGFGLADIKEEGAKVPEYLADGKPDPRKQALSYLFFAMDHIDTAIGVNCGFHDLRVFNSVHDALTILTVCTEEIKSQLKREKDERKSGKSYPTDGA